MDKHYRLILFLVPVIFFLVIPNSAFTKSITFQREYIYQASEADSKVSCRAIALEQVKRLLMEELGTYLESETQVKNYQLTKDQIKTLTAGIVRTEILDEKWDGKEYWLKAKITADPDKVANSIKALKEERQRVRELEETRAKADQALREVERLRQELALAKGKQATKKRKQYHEAIGKVRASDWLLKAFQSIFAGKYNEAQNAFSKAIELDPNNALAYFGRGVAYYSLKDSQQGFQNIDMAISLTHAERAWFLYASRGVMCKIQNDHSQGMFDLSKAIELMPEGIETESTYSRYTAATTYYERGELYRALGNFQSVIADYIKAIQLNPDRADSYAGRGMCYTMLGNDLQALTDYNRAIKLGLQSDEITAKVYHLRGFTYLKFKDMGSALKDIQVAAKLGYKEAQDIIEWTKNQARMGSKEAQEALTFVGIKW